MTHRLVVIGADAAGMSAAHQALRTARRLGRELSVTVLESSGHTSYSACGIPYWLGGAVGSGDDLVARTASQHREGGIDLRLHTRAESVDTATRTVRLADGQTLGYDDLMIATGATAIRPEWAADSPDIGAVKTLDDGAAWLDRFAAARPGARVMVVGGSYIGVEVAEAALARGFEVELCTRSRVMSSLAPELSTRITQTLQEAGVTVRENCGVRGVDLQDGRLRGVHTRGGRVEADLMVVGVGVRPATDIGDLPVSATGALRPDPHGRIAPGLWAAGDCCEVVHRVTGQWAYLPLGTHANKAGRATGDSIAGGDLRFDGALGTAITRFAHGAAYIEIGHTGIGVEEARAAGFDPVWRLTEGTTASGYMPEAEPIAIWVLADRASRRLLGVQVVGGHGAAKRVDAAAAVLWHEGTVDDLAWMDLSYAPPFATAWEILQVAARRVAETM